MDARDQERNSAVGTMGNRIRMGKCARKIELKYSELFVLVKKNI